MKCFNQTLEHEMHVQYMAYLSDKIHRVNIKIKELVKQRAALRWEREIENAHFNEILNTLKEYDHDH